MSRKGLFTEVKNTSTRVLSGQGILIEISVCLRSEAYFAVKLSPLPRKSLAELLSLLRAAEGQSAKDDVLEKEANIEEQPLLIDRLLNGKFKVAKIYNRNNTAISSQEVSLKDYCSNLMTSSSGGIQFSVLKPEFDDEAKRKTKILEATECLFRISEWSEVSQNGLTRRVGAFATEIAQAILQFDRSQKLAPILSRGCFQKLD
ncbi:MAG: hypothetical protein NTU49_03535 [Gammaproteobacteria bacterium]|nr:hypothetical protein [Gammaproteobacteria bacterium]